MISKQQQHYFLTIVFYLLCHLTHHRMDEVQYVYRWTRSLVRKLFFLYEVRKDFQYMSGELVQKYKRVEYVYLINYVIKI